MCRIAAPPTAQGAALRLLGALAPRSQIDLFSKSRGLGTWTGVAALAWVRDPPCTNRHVVGRRDSAREWSRALRALAPGAASPGLPPGACFPPGPARSRTNGGGRAASRGHVLGPRGAARAGPATNKKGPVAPGADAARGGVPAPARRGAAPLPGTFVGAGSDSVAQRETASVLAAVRGEAAPT